MRTKFIYGIIPSLLLASLFIVTSVTAQPISWQPERAVFVGHGWANTDPTIPGNQPHESIWYHQCYIRINGRKAAGTWSGSGFWMDLDYVDGKMTAWFTVENVDGTQLGHDPEPWHITEIFMLIGYARVFINGVFDATYWVRVELADSKYVNDPGIPDFRPDWIGFTLWNLDDTWGEDPPVYQTEHPRLKSGDIKTRWSPEYTE